MAHADVLEELQKGIIDGRIPVNTNIFADGHYPIGYEIVFFEALSAGIDALREKERTSPVTILNDALLKAKERYDKALSNNVQGVRMDKIGKGLAAIAHQLNEAKKTEMEEKRRR